MNEFKTLFFILNITFFLLGAAAILIAYEKGSLPPHESVNKIIHHIDRLDLEQIAIQDDAFQRGLIHAYLTLAYCLVLFSLLNLTLGIYIITSLMKKIKEKLLSR